MAFGPEKLSGHSSNGPQLFVSSCTFTVMVTESDLDGDNDAEVTTAVGMLMKVLNLAMHDI